MSPAPTWLAVIAAVCFVPYAHAFATMHTPRGPVPFAMDAAQADPGSTARDATDAADAVKGQPVVMGSRVAGNQPGMATPDAFQTE